MAVKVRRVAVIGAGPAGAIATDALAKEQAFDTIRVFDRRPIIGGTWYVGHHTQTVNQRGDKTDRMALQGYTRPISRQRSPPFPT